MKFIGLHRDSSWYIDTYIADILIEHERDIDALKYFCYRQSKPCSKTILKAGRGGHKLYNNGFNAPIAINKIYFNKTKKVTTVLWDDGWKTIVKLHKGEKWSKETAVAYAIAKRYSGSGRSFNKLIEEKGVDITKKGKKNEKEKK